MFPVVHPKTAMRNAVFIFNFIDLKTAMHNVFIKRTGKYTHTNIGVVSFLIFMSQK